MLDISPKVVLLVILCPDYQGRQREFLHKFFDPFQRNLALGVAHQLLELGIDILLLIYALATLLYPLHQLCISFKIPSPGSFVPKSMRRVLLCASFSLGHSSHSLQVGRLEAKLVKIGKRLQLDRTTLGLDLGVSFDKTLVGLLEELVVDGQPQFMALACVESGLLRVPSIGRWAW